MATSDKSVHSIESDEHGETATSLTHYDFVLAVIPVLLLAGLLVGNLAPVSLQLALGGAALVSVLVVIDALFVHPPSGRGGR